MPGATLRFRVLRLAFDVVTGHDPGAAKLMLNPMQQMPGLTA